MKISLAFIIFTALIFPTISAETIFSINQTGQEINQNNNVVKKNANFVEVATSLSITQRSGSFINLEVVIANAGQLNPADDILLEITSIQTRSSAGDLDIYYNLVDSNDIGAGLFLIDQGNVANFTLEDITGTSFNGNRNDVTVRNDLGVLSPLHNVGEQGVFESSLFFSNGQITTTVLFNGVEVSNFSVANPLDLTSELKFVIGLNDIGEEFTLDNLSVTLQTVEAVPEPSTYLFLVIFGLGMFLRSRKTNC